MPTIQTCGHESKRTSFTYEGSIPTGLTLKFDSGDFDVTAEVIQNVIENFRGRAVMGGFSMTNPVSGGVGEFLSQQANSLTPRHASFLCAVLNHEGYVNCSLYGNAVMVDFNK